MIYLREKPLLELLFDSNWFEVFNRPKFAGLQTSQGIYGEHNARYGNSGVVILDADPLCPKTLRLRVVFVSDNATAAVFQKFFEGGTWKKAEAWAEENLAMTMERSDLTKLGFEMRELA